MKPILLLFTSCHYSLASIPPLKTFHHHNQIPFFERSRLNAKKIFAFVNFRLFPFLHTTHSLFSTSLPTHLATFLHKDTQYLLECYHDSFEHNDGNTYIEMEFALRGSLRQILSVFCPIFFPLTPSLYLF